MGDVVQEFEEQIVEVEPPILDLKGKITRPAITKTELVPLEKDLSKCPCLSFTTAKAEALQIKEEPVEPIEKPLEEVLDGKMETKIIQ